MKVYLDDIRHAPKGFIHVKDAQSAIKLIIEDWDMIDEISLDHDLGDKKIVGDGYEVICAIEQFVYESGTEHLPVIRVHSSNGVGRRKMEQAIQSIETIVLSRSSIYEV